MKQYFTGFFTVLIFSLLLFSCDKDENEDVDYINCKWLKTRNLIGSNMFEIVYCESDCPSGDTIWDSDWVHYYRDDDMVEYKLIGSNTIRTWDLTTVTSYTYEPK
jgi:hypothetical protein|tara:strand:- start:108 stop:422 length:315 start_codon:yes stop_codon:yes gene_type:complete